MVAEAVLQEGNVVHEVKTPTEAFALLKGIFRFNDSTKKRPMIPTDPSKILIWEKKNGDFEVHARFYDEPDSDGKYIETMWIDINSEGVEERYHLGEKGLLSYNASHRSIQLNGREFSVKDPTYPFGGVVSFNNHDEGGQSSLLAIALAEEIRSRLESNV